MHVRTLLLDTLWGRPPEEGRFAALDEDDWATLLELTRRHRVAPLLHWRLKGTPAEGAVPDRARRLLETAYRQSVLRSLALQAELVRLHRTLDAEGIPHIALKGASLAFHTYPHPALRPMKDLDILVAPGQAVAAFRACVAAGYLHGSHGDLETALQDRHHLPPLRGESGRVAIELHRGLTSARVAAGGRTTLGEDPGFWSRATPRSFGADTIAVPSDTDMLLHVLVHATFQHRFDNGPLAGSDLLFLLQKAEIDWDLFWEMSTTGGWHRGCVLGLRMAARYDDGLEVTWPESDGSSPDSEQVTVPRSVMQSAIDLTLSAPGQRSHRQLRTALVRGSLPGRARLLWRRVFPPRRSLAMDYPAPRTSTKIFAYYPLHWARLLFRRAPSFLRMLRADRSGRDAAAMSRLDGWLDGGADAGDAP